MKIFKAIGSRLYAVSIFLIAIGFLTSCRSVRRVMQKENHIQNRERIISYRDTVFITEPAKSSLSIPINHFKSSESDFKTALKGISNPQKKPISYSQKNGNATVKVRYENDTIKVTAECDSIALRAKIRKEFEKDHRVSTEYHERSEKSGQSIWQTFIQIAVALVVGFGLGKLIKIGL